MKKFKKIISLMLAVLVVFGLFTTTDIVSFAEQEGVFYYLIYDDSLQLMSCDRSVTGHLDIPAELGGHSVDSIGYGAFTGCDGITSVTIPNTVEGLLECAFSSCKNLTSVIIPDSVDGIYSAAFLNCSKLKSITIPKKVKALYEKVFFGCTSLTDIKLPDDMTFIYWNTFYNTGYYNNASNWRNGLLYLNNYLICADKEIVDNCVIKYGTTLISGAIFYGSEKLTSVTIPNSVKYICDNAFNECKNISEVHFLGTQEEWEAINFGENNDLLLSAKISFEPQEMNYILGDVNKDGRVTAADARLALRISAKLETADDIQFLAADVDKNNKITAADARKILRVSAKLDEF